MDKKLEKWQLGNFLCSSCAYVVSYVAFKGTKKLKNFEKFPIFTAF